MARKQVTIPSRRSFLTVATAMSMRQRSSVSIGVTDWNLNEAGRAAAVAHARRLGFSGLQITLGEDPNKASLPLNDLDLQGQYLVAAQREQIVIDGTCIAIDLEQRFFKSGGFGLRWISDGIRITKKLKASVLLLPFFGAGTLRTRQEMNTVGDSLKELAGQAEESGVTLGIENTLSAEDNVRIMDRTGSSAIKVYYDVGNSTVNHFDVVTEILWLGRDRICQFHFKDDPYLLGQGPIAFPKVIAAIRQIGYSGFVNLETSSPSRDIDLDFRRNLHYVLGLFS